MNTRVNVCAVAVFLALGTSALIHAQTPPVIEYSGRVVVNGTNFSSTAAAPGFFKCILLTKNGSEATVWSSDGSPGNVSGSSSNGSEPTGSVELIDGSQTAPYVANGQFTLRLGEAGSTPPLSLDVLSDRSGNVRREVYLRIWFSRDNSVFQRLDPDVKLASAPYAIWAAGAETVRDRAITNAKLADGSVSVSKLQTNAVGTGQLQDGLITTAKLANGSVSGAKLGDGSVSGSKLANDSVSTARLINAAVSTAKIQDAAVTSAKIQDAAVASGKIQDGAITSVKLQDAAVTSGKIGPNSISTDHFGAQARLDAIIPPGTVLAYLGTNAPGGWLLCQGQAVSRLTYGRLYAVIGTASGSGDGSNTFNLPDLRGMFLRGRDPGIGVDPDCSNRVAAASGGNVGSAVGSLQADSFQTHDHKVYMTTRGATKHRTRDTPNPGDDDYWVSAFSRTNAPTDVYAAEELPPARVAQETRPKNICVNYIIKY